MRASLSGGKGESGQVLTARASSTGVNRGITTHFCCEKDAGRRGRGSPYP